VVRVQRARRLVDQEIRRISLVAKAPELTSKTKAPAGSKGTSGMPPVSGSSLVESDGEGVGLLVALEAEALAEALADAVAEALAEVEALDIVLAEALAEGLAIMLSSIPLSSIPLPSIPLWFMPLSSIPMSSIPRSSVWAAAIGAKISTASATHNAAVKDLRMLAPLIAIRIAPIYGQPRTPDCACR